MARCCSIDQPPSAMTPALSVVGWSGIHFVLESHRPGTECQTRILAENLAVRNEKWQIGGRDCLFSEMPPLETLPCRSFTGVVVQAHGGLLRGTGAGRLQLSSGVTRQMPAGLGRPSPRQSASLPAMMPWISSQLSPNGSRRLCTLIIGLVVPALAHGFQCQEVEKLLWCYPCVASRSRRSLL